MRFVMIFLTLLCVSSLDPAAAGDRPTQDSGDALIQAAQASPVSLSEILRRTHQSKHEALRVRFALDTSGQLTGQVLLRVSENGGHAFHEWAGPVYSAGWIPRRRVLEDEAELAEATRLARLGPARDVLWRALVEAVCPNRSDRPADVVLSAVPSFRDGKRAVDLYAGHGRRGRGVAFDPATDAFAPVDVAAPKRVPVDVRALPDLDVPEGEWFNTEIVPSLTNLRGRPVLLLVTSPG